MSLLSCNALTVSISGKSICQDLSLEFNAGENWAILGMNGSGKTTLLHTLAGLLSPVSGNINIAGTNINALSRREIAQQLGLLLQQQEDHFPGTVLETILIGRHPHIEHWQWESEEDIEIALNALTTVGLKNFEHRSIQTLSGGERQRVALATLLVQQTRVRLLDEAVNHLDIHHQHDVMKTLTVNNVDSVNVFVLHDVNLAARYCDHALLVHGNGETQQGLCNEILTEKNLSSLYQYPLREVSDKSQRWFISA